MPCNSQKKIEEANRWLETVRHYATMVDKTMQQLTTMQGVLRNVDEQLARNVRLVRFVSSVGQIVRGSYQLKRQLEGMIRYRIAMLKSIDDRLRNGIFNPQQDLNDLENYLKFTIGRSADETVARSISWPAMTASLKAGACAARKSRRTWPSLVRP